MRRRIAILTPTFPPYRGGIGALAARDAQQLAALGHAVRVYAPGLREAPAGDGGYATGNLHAWFRYGNAAFAPMLARIFAQHDVVLLHYPFFGVAEPLVLARFFFPKVKVLCMYHMDALGAGVMRPLFWIHAALMQPLVLRAADRILVTSGDYAASSRISRLFVRQPERFSVLPPAVDTEQFISGVKDPALLAEYGYAPTDRIAVFVGGLDRAHYFKGIPVLLRALAEPALAHVRLHIVGDGNLRPSYEALARSLGVADRVRFAGPIADEALPAHIRLGDVLVFPSVDRSEAFGLVALEALSCGVPVVASDLPGVRTIVRDDETGVRVPAGDHRALASAVAGLCADDARRQAMGTAGRALAVREYSLAVRVERWKKILVEAV